jgi:hypothetical protein
VSTGSTAIGLRLTCCGSMRRVIGPPISTLLSVSHSSIIALLLWAPADGAPDGRLRSLDQRDSTLQVIREYGLNDSIGELDVITAVPRSDTVHAIRDSELVRIPAALFDAISARHPATTVQFMRLIAARVRRAMGEASTAGKSTGGTEGSTTDVNLSKAIVTWGEGY